MRQIKLFATLREIAGTKEISVPLPDGATVRDLMQLIGQISTALHDKIITPEGTFTGLVHVYVSGRNVEWLQGLDTVIRESDDVFLIPPVAGG